VLSRRVLIVIPAYNEAERLPRLLAAVGEFLRSGERVRAEPPVDFLVVDDGSRQEQFEAVKAAVERLEQAARVRLMRLERNQGKGAAIRTGFARGLQESYGYLGFIDADSSVPITELQRAVTYLVDSAGAIAGVIGSRVQMLGRRVVRRAARHYTGRLFATFVSLYFHQPVYDTQCGLKLFAGDALRRHLSVPTDDRWVWDTQLLLAMLHAGEPIHEMPIDWTETGNSKVSLVRDPLRMVWHLVQFRRRLRAATPVHGDCERV
jgi:glycosyltransferase involved in cell wall biosynthesis